MRRIKIGKYLVGEGCSPFIMAEAGINHCGDLEKAFKMIAIAKRSGADAVKFQTFRAEEFIADPDLMFTYRSRGKEVAEPMLNMFRRYEFSKDKWPLIKARCDKEEIMFLSTPQNRSDLKILLGLGVQAVKVGSDDFTNISLLKEYAKTGLPMIISCGMADLQEIRRALNAIGAPGGYPTVLMVCTSEYPTPPKSVNLLRLKTLSGIFPKVILGFSDHSQGFLASSLAVALGASVFEKHFTLSHDLPGPDHWFSEDPESLKAWVSSIREAFVMAGNGVVKPTPRELVNKKTLRRVVVASRDVKKGQLFSMNNLAMKRISHGHGVSADMVYKLINKKANKDYRIDEAIGL
jgi:sialic acid synthase SpsE